MKRSRLKLLILESIALATLLFNIFFKRFLSEYTIVVFLTVLLFLSIILTGFEKNRRINGKKTNIIIFFYTLCYLIFMYGVGVFIGFTSNAYDLTIKGIILNLIPVILTIVLTEISRFNLIKKGEGSKLIFLLTILIFVAVDVSLVMHLYDVHNLKKLLELSTLIVVPSISKNFVMTDFTRKYGYIPCIIYQLIMNVYLYTIPIIPSFGLYLDSVISFLVPLAIFYTINGLLQKQSLEDVRNKHIPEKITCGILIVIIVIMIGLYSNLMPYWIAVIGSGSMEPTINVGDAIIVDKTYQKHLNKLKKGDILVFRIKDTIYTHRIIRIDKINEQYSIITRGDRKGQATDSWRVTNDDVVGVVKTRIPFLGQPTVWLNRVLEGRK